MNKLSVVTNRKPLEKPRTFTTNEQFIDEVRSLLWKSGRSWVQLAKRTGLSKTTVRKLASGETTWPRHTTLFAILMALHKGLAIVDR